MEDTRVDVAYEDDVAFLRLVSGDGRNVITDGFMENYHRALDTVESNQDIVAMVTTSTGKFFCNGFALQPPEGRQLVRQFLYNFCRLVARIATFPLPTVAAINGHCMAGGAFLAVAHDHRIMTSDKGWFSFTEIHVPMTVPPFLVAILQSKIQHGYSMTEGLVFGTRYNADGAKQAYFIQDVTSHDSLLHAKIRDLLKLGPLDRRILTHMKKDIYVQSLKMLYNLDTAIGLSGDLASDQVYAANL